MDGVAIAAAACAAGAAVAALGPSGASQRLTRLTNAPGAWPAVRVAAGVGGLQAALDLSAPAPADDPPALSQTRRLVAAAAAVAGGYALIGGIVGLAGGGVLGLLAWFRLGRLEPGSVVREREHMVTALPLAADLMAAALAAGCPPEQAVASVGQSLPGPLGRRLRAVAAALRVGTEPTHAWALVAGEAALRPLARVMANAARRGTSPVAALERIARDSEDVARWAAEARARSVGAKAAVPLGLCFLPAFILVGVVPLIATSLQLLS